MEIRDFLNKDWIYLPKDPSRKDALYGKLDRFRMKMLYILSDFDQTATRAGFTSSNHPNPNQKYATSHGAVEQEKYLGAGFMQEITELLNKYQPYEVDVTIDKEERTTYMLRMYQETADLYRKYWLNRELVEQAAWDLIIDFRKGFKWFIELANENDIPFYFISAWVSDFIEAFLRREEAMFNNIIISANPFVYDENGLCLGFEEDIIHPANKSHWSERGNRQTTLVGNAIVLWDRVHDVEVLNPDARSEALKIGFLSQKMSPKLDAFVDAYDIVVASDDDTRGVPAKILELIVQNSK